MSWYGKFLGGAFGFLMGGPLGAVFGAALGHQLDQNPEGIPIQTHGLSPAEAQEIQRVSFLALFRVMGHLAKADGRVSESELSQVRDILDRVVSTPEARLTAMRLFNEGKRDLSIDHLLGPMRPFVASQPQLMRWFISLLAEVALADGVMGPCKEGILLSVCEQLGFSRYEYFGIRTRLEAQLKFVQNRWQTSGRWQGAHGHYREERSSFAAQALRLGPLEKAYAVLGVSASATAAEVKKAYRRKISQHHPDKLTAQGISGEELRRMTEATQAIQAAYELISRSSHLD